MLVNVQFLRFIAAFLVVLYHASLHIKATGVDQGALFTVAQAIGFAGVDVFFVISGFIMYHTTADEAGVAASVNFLKRRIARIYSGYWPFFVLALIVVAWALPAQFERADAFASFWLWPLPLERILLPVSWTLSYEMYFYFMFTLLVLIGVGRRGRALALVFALILALNLHQHFVAARFAPENISGTSFWAQFATSPFIIEFYAGAVFAKVMDRCGLRLSQALLIVGAVLFLVAGYFNVRLYDGQIEQGYYVVPRVLVFGLPSVLILAGLVGLERNGRMAPRRFSLATGGASYAIYLSHTIVFAVTARLGFHDSLQPLGSAGVQAVYLALGASIVAACVLYYFTIERWLHRQAKRLLRVGKHA